MRQYRVVIFSLALFGSSFCQAQDGKTLYSFTPAFNIRTALNTLFDYDAGITLGAGYQWSRNFSAALEPTFIFYNAFITDREEKIFPSGIKIRADLKFMLSGPRHQWPAFFLSPEFHYKYVTTNRTDEFGMNRQNGQFAFIQTAVYKEVKKETGGLLKMGMIARMPFTKDDKWFFELYSGFGVKVVKFREENIPEGGAFITPPDYTILGRGNGSRTTDNRPIFPFGIKLFFVLGPAGR